MKSFLDFVGEGKVVRRSPAPSEARSVFLQAEQRLADLRTLPLNDANISFVAGHLPILKARFLR